MASGSEGSSMGSILGASVGGRVAPGAPIPANSIANRTAAPRSGLYQSCLALRDRLWCVPGFGEAFLEPRTGADEPPARAGGALYDPVTLLWQCFRLGTPLCALYNHLAPQLVPAMPLSAEANLSNANACKALVMRFLIALKEKLGWDSDDIFTVSQLYLNDTNGFVKVVRTVDMLVDLLDERGLLTDMPASPGMLHDQSAEYLDSPTDQHTHAVRELLESERKYVHDLEVMQHYALALGQHDILPPDTIYLLFSNLHQLVDVQRRFLICIEDNARRPAEDQHFGGIFRSMETDFAVYEPFCANYAQALDIITDEAEHLQHCYLDPAYELPTFLIKPVQRICKYPLLLEQMLKATASEAPRHAELVDALHIIRRITDKVNETSRSQENEQLAKDLGARVEDWKGHSLKSFGKLLHSDVFLVSKGESEREFHVYLFERILLCCKDLAGPTGTPSSSSHASMSSSRSRTKSSSLLRQRQGSISGNKKYASARSPLQLKGRIFMNNIVGINATRNAPRSGTDSAFGSYALQVWWRGESDVESFTLKCKNDEQLRLWQGALQKLLDEIALRRQQTAPLSMSAASAAPPMHLNLSGTAYNARAQRGFLHVATPVIPTPADCPLGMRPIMRGLSQSSRCSEDDDYVAAALAGCALGPSDVAEHPDDSAGPPDWSPIRPPPSYATPQNTAAASPLQVSSSRVCRPSGSAPPLFPRTMSNTSRAAQGKGVPSGAAPAMLRTASDGVAMRTALPGALAGGPGDTPQFSPKSQFASTHGSMSVSNTPPAQPGSPALAGWNPYFPSVSPLALSAGSSGASTVAPRNHSVSTASGVSAVTLDYSRAGSGSVDHSPTARKNSDPASSCSAGGCMANPPGMSPLVMPAVLLCSGEQAPTAIAFHATYASLCAQVRERLGAAGIPLPPRLRAEGGWTGHAGGAHGDAPGKESAERMRLFYIDGDRDRVLILDDDDLSMALDHSCSAPGPLELIVE
ncbi:Guanine nucleotide exchange factor for Cdc42p [Malassezia sp. CBS 17886]|nr:Guanine nucleotide exchange factor for Cdc42p [Malassezia sp. CBS 17886]